MPNEERHASGRARSSHFGDANCREHRDAEVMLRVGLPLPGVPAYPHRCDSGIRVAHRGNRAKGGVDMSANRENWRSQGVCRSYDPDLFFPVSSSGLFLEQVADAKAICMKCPVRSQCLEFALRTREAHGVWGGTSEQERCLLWRRDERRIDPDTGKGSPDRLHADDGSAPESAAIAHHAAPGVVHPRPRRPPHRGRPDHPHAKLVKP